MRSRRPRLVVTIGDPAGVGAEVVLKALACGRVKRLADWTVVGDGFVLTEAAKNSRASVDWARSFTLIDPHSLSVNPVAFGVTRADYGNAALNYVRIATEMCLAGKADGMVTAPLNKEAVSLSGRHFSGHTEYIAELCGSADSRMLLWNKRLSAVHVSTHIALRDALRLDEEKILKTIVLGAQALEWMGRKTPRVAVCGLNPHAGEGGLFGAEDDEIIRPAIRRAVELGLRCEGPVAPDTVFLKGSRGAYDLIVAMYHDQGHIPMKLINFEETVNITLGIPIVRTSVDHGTAFDIAGQNRADHRNMVAAMNAAAAMAAGRLTSRP